MIGGRIRDLQRAAQRPDSAIEISQRIADAYAHEALLIEVNRRWPVHERATEAEIDAALKFLADGMRELDRTVPR